MTGEAGDSPSATTIMASPSASATVSVVIPTRDRLPLLRGAVTSVVRQTMDAWELVIVDDASTDGTAQWLEELDDPRIRVLRNRSNLERSSSRNKGLFAAQGQYVLFLDDDDELRPGALERLSRALQANPRVVAAIGARCDVDDSAALRIQRHPRILPRKSNLWIDLLFGWVPQCGTALMRRDAVIAAGGWNEEMSMAEDRELWLRLAESGPAILVPNVVLNFRRHPGQDIRTLTARTEVRAEVWGEFLARLANPRDLRKAQRVIDAEALNRRANDLKSSGAYAKALGLYVLACERAPSLMSAPIAGQRLRRAIAACTARLPIEMLFSIRGSHQSSRNKRSAADGTDR